MRKKTFYFYIILFTAGCFQLCAQTYEGTSGSKKISIQKGPQFPPYVEATISFYEPSGNNILDAEESGQITVNLKNSGKGKARGISFNITPRSVSGIFFSADKEVGNLDPGEEVNVQVPIRAAFGVSSSMVNLNFYFSERNGFQPDPSILKFNTKAFVPPELIVLEGFDIIDANDNGMIESAELVTITAAIQNVGQGVAKDVNVKLKVGENVFFGGKEIKNEFYLGLLKPGVLKEFTFDVYTNKNAKGMPIFVTIDEYYGKFGKESFQLPLEFKKRLSKISEVQVVGIEDPSFGFALAGGFGIDVDTNIPRTDVDNKDAIAVIIGNRNYTNSDVPTVDFAIRDAAVVKEYMLKTFGYREGNIIYETDATQAKFFALFGTEKRDGKLQDYVKEGESDVFIYYSGHGAPDPESKDGYFVPVDCDPAMVDVTGYSLDLFYSKINNLGAKSITVVIDACFSGASGGGMLLKNISPVFIKVDETGRLADEVTVFTSASGEQVSSWYPEKKHSLYTYYFLKGLKGAADQDGNQAITAEEMQSYVLDKVSYMARKLNSREQTPSLQTLDRGKLLINF